MATVSDLTSRVLGIVKDDSFEGEVLGYLNRGLQFIASKVLLPGCDASDSVVTVVDDYKVALPTDYQRNLYWVVSSAQDRRISRLYESYTTFLRNYPNPTEDDVGDIRAVAFKGKYLHYQSVPATPDTLKLQYYRKPTALVDEDDVPEELPDHLQDELLVSYVCREIHGLIEEDIDGKKIQTAYWTMRFDQAMNDLREFADDHGEPDYVSDEADTPYILPLG